MKRERERRLRVLPNSETGRGERDTHCPTVKREKGETYGVLPNSETGGREAYGREGGIPTYKRERGRHITRYTPGCITVVYPPT